MSTAMMIAAALFLPLFPLSMVFNQAFMLARPAWLKILLLLIWPQAGILLMALSASPPPDWIIAWALFTALFYAYRALALHDALQWLGFMATSAWALLWLGNANTTLQHLEALAFSVSLVLATLIVAVIQKRFGAAHTRLRLGLAVVTPRLAGLLVVAILAVAATPLFPGFFTMLSMILAHAHAAPLLAVLVMLIWLLWTWSGAQLLQGIIVGEGNRHAAEDVSTAGAWGFALGFIVLAIAGVQFAGMLL